MENIKKKMESYGMDYETTINRFMGNEGLYVRMLGLLPKDDSMKKLELALDSGNLAEAFEAAHSLKGVSGNLGLNFLYDAVSEIVEPLRCEENRSDYPLLFETIKNAYGRAEAFLEELESM